MSSLTGLADFVFLFSTDISSLTGLGTVIALHRRLFLLPTVWIDIYIYSEGWMIIFRATLHPVRDVI